MRKLKYSQFLLLSLIFYVVFPTELFFYIKWSLRIQFWCFDSLFDMYSNVPLVCVSGLRVKQSKVNYSAIIFGQMNIILRFYFFKFPREIKVEFKLQIIYSKNASVKGIIFTADVFTLKTNVRTILNMWKRFHLPLGTPLETLLILPSGGW